jgi:hypothetical protein
MTEDTCLMRSAEFDEDMEPEDREHGYPEGRGCRTCEFYERADYEYERSMDR